MLRYSWYINQTRRQFKTKLLPWTQEQSFEFDNVGRVPLCQQIYEGHLESKERFAIKKYLLIIGKKKNMQILSHTFTYFST